MLCYVIVACLKCRTMLVECTAVVFWQAGRAATVFRQAVQLLFFFSHQVGQLQICPLLHVLQIDLCESFDHLKPLQEY